MGTRGQIGRCSKCTNVPKPYPEGPNSPDSGFGPRVTNYENCLTIPKYIPNRSAFRVRKGYNFIRVPKFQKNANCDWGVAKFAIVDFVKNINGLRCRSRNFPSAILGWIRDYWKLGIEKIRHQNRKSKFINVARWSEMWLYRHPAGWNL